MSKEPFRLREGSERDFPALARLDGSFPNDWVLTIDRRGDRAEQTIALRWRRAKPAGSVRGETAGAQREQIEELETEWRRSDRLVVAEVGGAIAGYLMLGTN